MQVVEGASPAQQRRNKVADEGFLKWGVLDLGGLKDTMVLSILAWSNDLDDMGYPHDLGNHMYTV